MGILLDENPNTETRMRRWMQIFARFLNRGEIAGAGLSADDGVIDVNAGRSLFIPATGDACLGESPACAIDELEVDIYADSDGGGLEHKTDTSVSPNRVRLSVLLDDPVSGLEFDNNGLQVKIDDDAANVLAISADGLLVDPASIDHGDLSGLGDDDHSAYMLAESSVTDNALVRWDGTGGRMVQDSGWTLDDDDDMTAAGSLDMGGEDIIMDPNGGLLLHATANDELTIAFSTVGDIEITPGQIAAANVNNSGGIDLTIISGRDTTGFGGAGGDLYLRAADGAAGNAGGDVFIQPGLGPASGGDGVVIVRDHTGAGVVNFRSAGTLFLKDIDCSGQNVSNVATLDMSAVNGVAISGAAGATLGNTGGGTGPATAAQNQWLTIDINGTTYFVPVWI